MNPIPLRILSECLSQARGGSSREKSNHDEEQAGLEPEESTGREAATAPKVDNAQDGTATPWVSKDGRTYRFPRSIIEDKKYRTMRLHQLEEQFQNGTLNFADYSDLVEFKYQPKFDGTLSVNTLYSRAIQHGHPQPTPQPQMSGPQQSNSSSGNGDPAQTTHVQSQSGPSGGSSGATNHSGNGPSGGSSGVVNPPSSGGPSCGSTTYHGNQVQGGTGYNSGGHGGATHSSHTQPPGSHGGSGGVPHNYGGNSHGGNYHGGGGNNHNYSHGPSPYMPNYIKSQRDLDTYAANLPPDAWASSLDQETLDWMSGNKHSRTQQCGRFQLESADLEKDFGITNALDRDLIIAHCWL